MPILSVIIPVYNTGKYLKKCLDSVINQTLDNIEIIVINDGSTDDSLQIINEYIEKYNNIKLIHKKNEGASIARNIGICKAKGKYITFLDSDDYIDLDMYKDMIFKLEKESADVIQCGIDFIDQYSEQTIRYLQNDILNLDNNDALKLFINLKITGYTCNKIYKRTLFIENNITYSNIPCYEDMEVVLKSIMNCNKFLSISNCYYKYRQVEGSLSNKVTEKHIKIYTNEVKRWLEILDNGEQMSFSSYIETFNITTFMTALNWYIKIKDFNRKKIYKDFNIYFKDIIPDVNIAKCLLNKDISRGFKLTYILWKLRIYDLVIKYKIL